MTLFVLCKPPTGDALKLLEAEPEGLVLLLGKALLSDLRLFDNRTVYAVQEEVRELGLESRLTARVQPRPSSEVIHVLCENHILNL